MREATRGDPRFSSIEKLPRIVGPVLSNGICRPSLNGGVSLWRQRFKLVRCLPVDPPASSSTSRRNEHNPLHEPERLESKKRRENKLMTSTMTGLAAHGPSQPGSSRAAGTLVTNSASPTGSKARRRQPSRTVPSSWPILTSLGLSPEAKEGRIGSIGGSDANTILSGSPERVLRLWREKRGEEAAEDLSNNLAVMLGCWSEAFNRQWYERATGARVSRVGERVSCAEHAWRGATLDGYVESDGAVWEAKHTSAFTKPEDACARYMPQLQHAMAVTRSERAVLSVIFGNAKWEVFEIAADWLYQADLLEAEMRFWDCVQTGEPPVALPPPPAPRPVGVREVCLEGSNAWAAAAADWMQHRLAAKKHAEAAAQIKQLVEPDVARAFGHGIEARRSKAGAVSIRELGA